MSAKTSIEWVDGGSTWNPIRARNRETGKIGWFCSHVTPGCEHCYSEAINRRLGTGVDFKAQNRDKVEMFLDENILTQPLRWRRPRKIFPNSMTDWMADFVPDKWIDKIMAVMALCPQHQFLTLTKRAERQRDYLRCGIEEDSPRNLGFRWALAASAIRASGNPGEAPDFPLKNVWIGVSVEDQARADERIPLLIETPAAIRWLSVEPMLGPVELWNMDEGVLRGCAVIRSGGMSASTPSEPAEGYDDSYPGIDWIVIGGESGANARPFNIEWARSIIAQCKIAEVPVFCKQLGAKPIGDRGGFRPRHLRPLYLKDRKGGDISEWPSDLRVREYPQ